MYTLCWGYYWISTFKWANFGTIYTAFSTSSHSSNQCINFWPTIALLHVILTSAHTVCMYPLQPHVVLPHSWLYTGDSYNVFLPGSWHIGDGVYVCAKVILYSIHAEMRSCLVFFCCVAVKIWFMSPSNRRLRHPHEPWGQKAFYIGSVLVWDKEVF